MEAENQKKSRCTVEGDLELLRRYRNGDEEAMRALLESHFALINSWVCNVFAWAEREDVMQVASIAFVQAAVKFDVSRNRNFHVLARLRVRTAIYRSPEVSPVKRILYDHKSKVIEAQDKLMRELNRSPTLKELAQETKLSAKQVDNALNVIAAFPTILDEADGVVSKEDPLSSQLIRDAIKQLSSDESEIIILYYFYGYTDREIGEALGKSEDAIKMVRRRALKKLRDIISGEGGRKDGT